MSEQSLSEKVRKWDLTHGQAMLCYILFVITGELGIIRLYGEIAHTDNLVDVRFFASKAVGVLLITGMFFASRYTDMKINWKGIGGSPEVIRKSLLYGGIMALIVTAVLYGFRQYLNTLSPENKEIPAFGLYLNMNTRWFCPVNMPLQELFIKCFIQDNMRKLFHGKHRHLSILLTSVFFFIIHLQYPFHYMFGAWLLCFVTGYLYDRYPSIWGPFLVHFAIGFLPRSFGIFDIIE